MLKKREMTVGDRRRYYKDICLLSLPLLAMSYFYYGLRPVLMGVAAMLLGNLCDRLVSFIRKRQYQPGDYSNESFALLIALLLPAGCSWYVLAVAVLAGVLIGKEAFGGYGSYPFHPSAVGYVVAAVSWPDQVFRYPAPGTVLPLGDTSGVAMVGGMSHVLKNGAMPNTGLLDMLLGNYAGPMGTTAVLVILACGLFLLVRRDIRLYTPVAFLATCALIAFAMPRRAVVESAALAQTMGGRVDIMIYELISGSTLFCALFLATEPFTSPRKHRGGQALYGIVLGIAVMAFRYYGVYDTGVCFALLAVDSISEWLDALTEALYGWLARLRKKGGTAHA